MQPKTFKTFLEAQVKPYDHEPKEVNELIELIRKHCMDTIRGIRVGRSRISRGSRSILASGVYYPNSGERSSKNTTNYYTQLVDSNPANKDFPKRAKSFIATTNDDRAHSYARGGFGSKMAVFPFDGVKIGVVNSEDFWDTILKFKEPIYSSTEIPDLNHIWSDMFSALGKQDFVPTMSELQKFLKDADPVIVMKYLKDNAYFAIENDADPKEVLRELIMQLPRVYSYESLGCTLSTAGNIKKSNTELWFSGPCIMVKPKDMHAIEEEFEL